METNKIARTDALADIRGKIIKEIGELFDKMSIEANQSNEAHQRLVSRNVPLYLPNMHEDIWNGDETVWDIYKYKDDETDQIWIETGEDYYTLYELYADDLMSILNFMDWLNGNPEKYKEFVKYYRNE